MVVIDPGAGLSFLASAKDVFFKLISSQLGVTLELVDDRLFVTGPGTQVTKAKRVVERLLAAEESGESLEERDVMNFIQSLKIADQVDPAEAATTPILITYRGKRIAPKTSGQMLLVEAMRKHDVVFCSGPAGTGKSFLAVAHAVSLLREKQVTRLVLVRPAVEAGERLGFLPGDLEEKVNPYLRPLYDALHEFLGQREVEDLAERGAIEIAPLAFMRGRTLNDACVILDEAQNTSIDQMKMFLTRLGRRGKMVITGDVTQTDLPSNQASGLNHAMKILADVPGIASVVLQQQDVVRHSLVQKIVETYERHAPAPNNKQGV